MPWEKHGALNKSRRYLLKCLSLCFVDSRSKAWLNGDWTLLKVKGREVSEGISGILGSRTVFPMDGLAECLLE